MTGDTEEPAIPGLGGEQQQLADCNDAAVVLSGTTLDITDLVGQAGTLSVHPSLARSARDPGAKPSDREAVLRMTQVEG